MNFAERQGWMPGWGVEEVKGGWEKGDREWGWGWNVSPKHNAISPKTIIYFYQIIFPREWSLISHPTFLRTYKNGGDWTFMSIKWHPRSKQKNVLRGVLAGRKKGWKCETNNNGVGVGDGERKGWGVRRGYTSIPIRTTLNFNQNLKIIESRCGYYDLGSSEFNNAHAHRAIACR